MKALITACLRRPLWLFGAWALAAACAALLAVQLPGAVRGSAGAIEQSESGRVAASIQRHFGSGTGYLFPVVVRSRTLDAASPGFTASVAAIALALEATPGVRAVERYAASGRDGRSSLLLVVPDVSSFFEAENLTVALRAAVAAAAVAPGIEASVTGMPAVFHDLNRKSSSDLLRAERVAVPLALAVLLLVFRAPLAALLPVMVAVVAVTFACAGLYVLRDLLPVSAFAQNGVSMIGLGVGVDYALILMSRLRAQLEKAKSHVEAVRAAAAQSSRPVLVAGLCVALGCLGLAFVRAEFVHGIAIGGLLVVCAAVAATLTLLPAVLALCGRSVYWPARRPVGPRSGRWWQWWADALMRHPWPSFIAGLAVAAALALPASRMTIANAGVHQLDERFEARRGFDELVRNFEPGWMGPVALLLEPAPQEEALSAMRERLATDPRVALIDARVSAGGEAALLALVMRHAPDSAAAFEHLRSLREAREPARIGGPSAMIEDFDAEIFGSLWRVVPAVLLATFVALLVAFRSPVVALKAVTLNVVSVLAAYGFLVLVFPAGLNALVVLMLFTLLFGISMDYEIFLLGAVRESYRRTLDNRGAVRAGVVAAAPVLTGAAAIMVAVFASFALTELVATRQFGLGLAFAVALDATLIRLVLLPALMELLGAANWWWPGGATSADRACAGAPRAG